MSRQDMLPSVARTAAMMPHYVIALRPMRWRKHLGSQVDARQAGKRSH